MGITAGLEETGKAYVRKRRVRSNARNIRLPWSAYGIGKERMRELMQIAKMDEYADLVLAAAIKANRQAADHIILSVTRSIPFDFLEFHEKLGRCSLGRSDFYGVRRLFFHYLDVALKQLQGAPAQGKDIGQGGSYECVDGNGAG